MSIRPVFFVSDGTGITAETLGRSLLTQFEGLDFKQTVIPFVDSEEKAEECLQRFEAAKREYGVRPVVFSTLLKAGVRAVIGRADALVFDFFESFLSPLEAELGMRSSHTVGRSHSMGDTPDYQARIEAVNFALAYDDGQEARGLEDADVILIGEIRDRETMSMAIAYAQSGHLCLATLHANNSYHALNRIISFYPLENRAALLQDLSASLKCIISQRLVRSLKGGRVPAVEVMLNTRHIAELIEEGNINGIKEAMEKSLSPGSQTFEQALFRMYKDGVISKDEALAHADSANNLLWLINNSEGKTGPATPPPAPTISQPTEVLPSGASFSEFKLTLGD